MALMISFIGNVIRDVIGNVIGNDIANDIASGFKEKSEQIYMLDIPQLHEEIAENYSDLLGPLPLKLPPFCEVSHEIPLINESKQLKHRLPKCPEVFHSELARKIK